MNSRFEFISFQKSWENAGAPRFRGVFHFGPVWGGLNWRAAPSGVGFVFLRWHRATFPHLIFPSPPCKNKLFLPNFTALWSFFEVFFSNSEIKWFRSNNFIKFRGFPSKLLLPRVLFSEQEQSKFKQIRALYHGDPKDHKFTLPEKVRFLGYFPENFFPKIV